MKNLTLHSTRISKHIGSRTIDLGFKLKGIQTKHVFIQKTKYLLVALLMILLGQISSLQAQVNIDCANAQIIHCTESFTGNNTAAPIQTLLDCEFGGTAPFKALWYKFIGDGSTMALTLCSSNTDFNTYLQVLEGDCGSLTCVSFDNDGCPAPQGTASVVSNINTVSGQVYYAFVTGPTLGSTGNFQISLSCANTPPPNSVSVTSNGPICEGEVGEYYIAPSPSADPTPGGLVYYTLDGNFGFTYLDENGEATVEVPGLAVGLPASLMELDEIRNQNNLNPLALGNGADIEVRANPEITSFAPTTGNPICEGEDQFWTVTGTPNADYVVVFNGASNIGNLGPSGTEFWSTEFVPGTYDNFVSEVSLNGCTVDYTTEFEVEYTVNPLPAITSVSFTPNPATASNVENITFAVEGTPNATFTITEEGTPFTFTLDATGNFGFDFSWDTPGIYTYIVTDVTLNGCTTTYTTEWVTELEILAPCLDFMVRNYNPEDGNIYQAASFISSTSTVSSLGGAVTYDSQEISLEGGFEVLAGAEFDATIGGCIVNNPCGLVTSQTFIADVPDEFLRWNTAENATCITELVNGAGDPSPEIQIDVMDFASGSSGPVDVQVELVPPTGGAVSIPLVVDAGLSSEYIGIFTGVNGTVYDVTIFFDYDGVQFLYATVEMVPQ